MNLRPCISIPTFDNPTTILKVIQDCVELTAYPIVIIDDGSAEPILGLIQSSPLSSSFSNNRVRVVRHEKNEGKGRAIQTAFRFALENDYTHLIMMDGDGQHFAKEISKMMAEAEAHPWDLILGNRELVGESVPEISKFGRKFSNFWVKFETKTEVLDSQSGFRVYPLFQVQNLKFWTKRFDFEIEILIRLIWKGVQIREVDIACYYPPKNERVSHFHKLHDNIRISILNIFFIVVSLLRKPQSALLAATAVSIGVFVGTLPLYGLHTFIAAGLSFALRLNFIYLWLGTQISLPFLIPLLIMAALQISKSVPMSMLGSWFTLALALGVAGFVLTYVLSLCLQPKKKSGGSVWTGRTRGGAFGNAIMKRVIQHGGIPAAYFCLYFIVPYFYLFAPAARRAFNEYWSTLRPEWGWFKRQQQILNHFNRFARILVDRAFQQHKKEMMFQVEAKGFENIQNKIAEKKGLIMVTAHVGGWDLAVRNLLKKGAGDFKIVKYEAEGLTYEKVIGQSNENVAHSVFDIRELLDKGNLVGLMGDRPIGRHIELVRFFGKLVVMDATPFRIAAICKVPVLFTFSFKGEGNWYHFSATTARSYTSAESLLALKDYAAELERLVTLYPDQWFNFYSFWSTIPPNDKQPRH